MRITAARGTARSAAGHTNCDGGYCQGIKPGELNSPDFHEIAIIPQSPAAIVTTVALLTGRVYQDGLGGLRAVLFNFWRVSRPYPRSLRSLSFPARSEPAIASGITFNCGKL